MTEAEAIALTLAHLRKQFPKRCGKCAREFIDLADYLRKTRHAGPPMSYDAEAGDWQPQHPRGTLSIAHCECGSSVSVTSAGMPLPTMWKLLKWGRAECLNRGVTLTALLEDLRRKIDVMVLGEGGQAAMPVPRESPSRT